jgi:hypothetical protein
VEDFSDNQEQPTRWQASSGGGTLGRRGVLGGLAALPVLYGVGTAGLAGVAVGAARPGSVPSVTDGLAAGAERRYNAPLLRPGTRLVLPKGITAVSVLDYYHRPFLAPGESAWPSVTAANGMLVDASVIPERGAPTRVAVLTGFANGWYDVIHANGRADHVAWDAGQFPFLWAYGEFGATNEAPFRNRIYSLSLQPLSRNPYSRSNPAR